MAITINGSGITSSEIADGTITTDDIASGVTGKVLQVVQTTSNSQTYIGNSYTDITGTSISITPTSASSKILLIFNAGGMIQGTNALDIWMKISKNSTTIREIKRWMYYNSNNYGAVPIALQYLDSPSTTSSVTYKLSTKQNQSTTSTYRIADENSPYSNAVIAIAMEIGA